MWSYGNDFARNDFIIFSVDNTSLSHINNKKITF